MQAFVTSSITCPSGQTHCGRSYTDPGLGLLQVAFVPKQPEVKNCPSTGHCTNKNIIKRRIQKTFWE